MGEDLGIHAAASSTSSQLFLGVGLLFLLPAILGYTVWSYRVFRGKVEAGDGCSWTAVSRDSWIRVTRGASGSGDGTVELSVDANQADDKRSGTVEIGGVTVKITQEGD